MQWEHAGPTNTHTHIHTHTHTNWSSEISLRYIKKGGCGELQLSEPET